MKNRLAAIICVCCLAAPWAAAGQDVSSTGETTTQVPGAPIAPTPPVTGVVVPATDTFWTPFAQVPKDFVNFFSMDTAKILGVGAAGLMVGHRWDDDWQRMAIERLNPGAFNAGNVWGGLYSQIGSSFTVYAIGRSMGNRRVSALGGDLLRAHVVTQGYVQALKFSTQRLRPDGSNNLSFPSGHTAGAVATATVMQRHFGWKVGLPSYAVSAYVGASRLSANKHHLTDVMFGAAIGLAAGRTTTIGVAKQRFNVGVAPTVGGAAITITKQ
jgi:hypothetical protein